ncbi:hypothetical protein CDQ84_06840 [Clostridium thermosuccinogenes]|uniref:Uncharacterized protein n=1 Tax=Clostridium thermosuccinogenes TaxID=84032 RepID=A0A2K2FNN1_9CLOT|nr:NusG domain II-containing protein [Pseudoclostridium thermosuccinogenes]AUS97410.1 hypothetical protein CDO33_13750 [Pseudoclostridium thermosuccinogenes]PNT98239.1 hypothetical protein CDQ85_06340 [Pseudoclostridium thermosuccinogenes]PNU00389.1 hypothetical protein CDQ84_06840 [Pseudoclostridium thermosuccinogenes]
MKKKSLCLMNVFTSYDVILIALILIITIVLYGVFTRNHKKSPDDVVVVQRKGAVLLQLTQDDLNKNGIYDFEFDGEIGYIEVKERKVRMLPMDRTICPQAICSNTGWIDGYPKTIVCMPNQIIVSFKSDSNSQVDVISF